jgi:arginine/serine-rich splicing factor 16
LKNKFLFGKVNKKFAKMWHEARKQEKKIKGMLVDYRKRADRRKEYYERIRADPIRFMQIHGRKCKINFEVTDVTDDTHM